MSKCHIVGNHVSWLKFFFYNFLSSGGLFFCLYRDASKSPTATGSDTSSPRPGSAVSPGVTPSAQLPQGPRQQKPAQAQKKKKKKGGGKW